jgi:hypothetical protein
VHVGIAPVGVQLRGWNLLCYQAVAWHQPYRLVSHRRPRLEGEQDVTAISANLVLESISRQNDLDRSQQRNRLMCFIVHWWRTCVAQTVL